MIFFAHDWNENYAHMGWVCCISIVSFIPSEFVVKRSKWTGGLQLVKERDAEKLPMEIVNIYSHEWCSVLQPNFASQTNRKTYWISVRNTALLCCMNVRVYVRLTDKVIVIGKSNGYYLFAIHRQTYIYFIKKRTEITSRNWNVSVQEYTNTFSIHLNELWWCKVGSVFY